MVTIPTIDLGGNTVVVNTLRVGATKPGQAGTELAGAELTLLDGVTAGTITASKVVTADASGLVPHTRHVIADTAFASPRALTAIESGALCVFDNTAGSVFTLPAAAVGLYYDFVVAVASSSNSSRVACTTGDFIVGSVMAHATDDTGLSSAFAANGTTHLAIQLDSDATGRLAGSKFRLTAISGTQWVIEGDLLATGTVATPFETS
jgi:hypothetical protein